MKTYYYVYECDVFDDEGLWRATVICSASSEQEASDAASDFSEAPLGADVFVYQWEGVGADDGPKVLYYSNAYD